MIENSKFLTVSALTKYIKGVLESDTNLFKVLVKGEISNCKKYSSGHTYFTLKDANSQISCVKFQLTKIPIELKDGMSVLLTGRLRVYEPNGNYQIIVETAVTDGVGELYEKFEKLKKELFEKGYFDESHKRPLKRFPRKIGVVTSKSGAVIEDIKNIIRFRYPLAEIILYPSSVQGDNAIKELVSQIEYANMKNEVDTLIVGRGGGSLEDLWAFNEKEVALAVYNSKIPVISAVGHETDYTICDFVADLRAETPTAAAVAATPSVVDLTNQITNDIKTLRMNYQSMLEYKKSIIKELDKKLVYYSPESRLNLMKEKYNSLVLNLSKNYKNILENKELKLQNLMEKNDININAILDYKKSIFEKYSYTLKNLNPLQIMDKGFSIVEKNSKLIKSVSDVNPGDLIDVKLKDGTIKAEVKEK